MRKIPHLCVFDHYTHSTLNALRTTTTFQGSIHWPKLVRYNAVHLYLWFCLTYGSPANDTWYAVILLRLNLAYSDFYLNLCFNSKRWSSITRVYPLCSFTIQLSLFNLSFFNTFLFFLNEMNTKWNKEKIQTFYIWTDLIKNTPRLPTIHPAWRFQAKWGELPVGQLLSV